MRKKILICILLIFAVTLVGCSGNKKSISKSENKEITLNVFIAASLSNVMEDIKETYHKENEKVNIVFNADSSGTLQRQIEEGADCNIFFSAAEDKMDDLKEKGYLETNSIHKLLTNKVVLIKAKEQKTSVSGFQDIVHAKNIALAAPDVPVGAYAREILQTLGNYDQVMKMEINEGSNVSAVLAAVSQMSNEVGIVYATDAMSIKDSVEVIAEAKDEWMKSPVVYPVAIVNNKKANSEVRQAAQDFLKYLQSEETKTIFRKYGFDMYSEGE